MRILRLSSSIIFFDEEMFWKNVQVIKSRILVGSANLFLRKIQYRISSYILLNIYSQSLLD